MKKIRILTIVTFLIAFAALAAFFKPNAQPCADIFSATDIHGWRTTCGN